jgi:hypothetical protein
MATEVTETVEENGQTLQPLPPSHAGGKKPKDKLIVGPPKIRGIKKQLKIKI